MAMLRQRAKLQHFATRMALQRRNPGDDPLRRHGRLRVEIRRIPELLDGHRLSRYPVLHRRRGPCMQMLRTNPTVTESPTFALPGSTAVSWVSPVAYFTSTPSLNTCVISALKKFIFGEPIKPATNLFCGA